MDGDAARVQTFPLALDEVGGASDATSGVRGQLVRTRAGYPKSHHGG